MTVRRVVPSRYVTWAGNTDGNQLAITFDDGPHPKYTPQILAALRDAGVRATFFVLGSQIEKHPEIVAEMIRDGHELGNHTYSHANLGRISWRRGCEELRLTDRLLREQDPRYQGLFRPPWGRIGLGGAMYGIRDGCRAALWSVDSRDYRLDGVPPLIERIRAAPVTAGDILLFHDDNAYTAEAMPTILSLLEKQGFSFTTVSDLVGKIERVPKDGGGQTRNLVSPNLQRVIPRTSNEE
jgi:peptidoglycan/xylan/chitin deacetylase (PgdA/CDA1 family)